MPLLHGPDRVHEVKASRRSAECFFYDCLRYQSPNSEFSFTETEHAAVRQELGTGEKKLDGLQGSLNLKDALADPLLHDLGKDRRKLENRLNVGEFVKLPVLRKMQHLGDF